MARGEIELVSFKKMPLVILFALAATCARALEVEVVTSYSTDPGGTYVGSLTCGSTTNASGCFGSASLGPFTRACAIVASPDSIKTEPDGSTTYSRRVAILDKGVQAGAPATLFIYLEATNAKLTFATTQTTLLKTITLDVIGGQAASCFMARSPAGFYVGTNQSPTAVRVADNFSTTQLPGFWPPILVSGITSTNDGHIAVTHRGGFTVYRDDGSILQSGGGDLFLVGAGNAAPLGSTSRVPPPIALSRTMGVSQPSLAAPTGSTTNPTVRDASGRVIFANANPLRYSRAPQVPSPLQNSPSPAAPSVSPTGSNLLEANIHR